MPRYNTAFYQRSDTFTGTGNGGTVDATDSPVSSFALQVTGTGAAPTSWTVILEGTLDGTTFTEIMRHDNVQDSNGVTKFSGALRYPCNQFRTRCSALTLGSATDIVVQLLAMR